MGGVWEGFGKGLGRFGRILKGLGAFCALLELFARFCMYFQIFVAFFHILDQSSQAKPCFPFSSLRLRASTALKHFRSSRSLLRQVSQVGLVGTFLAFFFQLFFLTPLLIRFSSVLEWFWRPSWPRKSIFGEFFGTFFGHAYLKAFFA